MFRVTDPSDAVVSSAQWETTASLPDFNGCQAETLHQRVLMAIKANIRNLLTTLVLAILFASTASSLARTLDDPVAGGTILSNRADATYLDSNGVTFSTVSPTVTVTVVAVPTLAVTPKETEPSANVGPRERITRLFRICNTGNVTTSYTVTQAEVNAPATLVSLLFDNDASGTLKSADPLVTVGATLSQPVSPGSCLGVLAVIDTNDSPAGGLLKIRLTARANATNTANGSGEDNGTIINSIGKETHLSSPINAALPPVKQVNGSGRAVVTHGTVFTYTIAFRNSGDVTARAVVTADDLPAGVEYVANSLRLDDNGLRNLTDAQDADGGLVSGQHIEVRLAELAPDRVVRIMFDAQLSNNAPAAVGLINIAQLAGTNVAVTKSDAAVVVADPFGTVFAGRAGANAPIPGARVAVFSDQTLATLLPLFADEGLAPNSQNLNPFVSDTLGHFNFALAALSLGADAALSRYFVRVQADGFRSRLIELDLTAKEAGLFSLTERALDAQPLAVGGGFSLVRQDVKIDSLRCLAFNIPMFEEKGLGITKSVDVQRAEIGDVVTYRVEIRNPTVATISDVSVHDRLPDSFHYVRGTARLDLGSAPERQLEPEVAGAELLFRIGELGPGAGAHLLYRVRIGVNAREGDVDNIAVGSGVFPSGERSETGAARATVRVGGGVFSPQQVIIGRVFEDVNRNSIFDAGDKPIPGVRLYLTSGQSVITDSAGLYNFPSLGDGPQVISLDPVSVPKGYVLADGGTLAGKSWTRLLRTPVGGGALLRQNFALVSADKQAANAAASNKATQKENRAAQAVADPISQRSEEAGGPRADTTDPAPLLSATASPSAFGSPLPEQLAKLPNHISAPGTYELAAAETIEPVIPGDVRILSPSSTSVVMSPALVIEARVTLNWTVKLEVNGEQVSDKNIGVSRLDHKNQVSTFTFVGITLRPGSNHIRVTAISPAGTAGRTEEVLVMGRGPARRLEIIPDKNEIESGGRDYTVVRVRAFDQWGNPALDGEVGIETTAGQLLRITDHVGAPQSALPQDVSKTPPAEQVNQVRSQLIVPLEGGEAVLKLVSSGAPGTTRLHAQTGQIEAQGEVRITSEQRPTILVGLAEMSFGKSIPEVSLRGEEGNYRGRLSFFYKGRLWGNNVLTLAYDSQRPINRTAGRDRLFQLDPLDRVYPLFGDSSTRYEAAPSNSKLYARVDHKRSYAMFGDFETDMNDTPLVAYARKLTGVKAHLENNQGDFVTITGARPDTAFARDVFPGGSLGIVQLSHGEILPGSETVVLEVRDRRNPEVIISREILTRSVDYNLDAITGQLFFLRYISTFDYVLNLMQIVVTYEHRATGLSSAVYTARARKNFKGLGLKLGLSTVLQRQGDSGEFFLGGIDAEKSLPRGGSLKFAWAHSQGEIMGSGNVVEADDTTHNGNAYQVTLAQPLPFYGAVVRARYLTASTGFFNPFGATVTPGSRRGEVTLEMKLLPKSTLHFGMTSERNRTTNVDNSRLTLSAAWDQILNERIRFHFGLDHRDFTDDLNQRKTDSNLITAAVDLQLTDKLQLSVKREQNLGAADPTYPTQTTLAGTYQVNALTKLFLTQRFAAAPITPIGDFSGTGFAASSARRETAIGIETRFGKWTSMTGRYQLENAANGSDSFAIIGLQNRLPVTKQLSLELGFEHGFHLLGANQSFNSGTIGFGWQPNSDFRASARYEYRDRGGLGQLFAAGAAGRLREGITAMSRFQWSRGGFSGRTNSSMEVAAALAIRPLKSDRVGLLFSYTRRSLMQDGLAGNRPTRDRVDSLSTDGYGQVTKRLELYGRFALHFSANGQPQLPLVSSLTFLTQARAQYRLTPRLDWAVETRLLFQPSSGTTRSVYATEAGFWVLPDVRLGGGYNFTSAKEPAGGQILPTHRGFYFTISSKLSNLFDLFGTSKEGLAGSGKESPFKAGNK